MPKGIDVLHTFAVDEADGSTTLYLDRENCATGASGIFKIKDADSASW